MRSFHLEEVVSVREPVAHGGDETGSEAKVGLESGVAEGEPAESLAEMLAARPAGSVIAPGLEGKSARSTATQDAQLTHGHLDLPRPLLRVHVLRRPTYHFPAHLHHRLQRKPFHLRSLRIAQYRLRADESFASCNWRAV